MRRMTTMNTSMAVPRRRPRTERAAATTAAKRAVPRPRRVPAGRHRPGRGRRPRGAALRRRRRSGWPRNSRLRRRRTGGILTAVGRGASSAPTAASPSSGTVGNGQRLGVDVDAHVVPTANLRVHRKKHLGLAKTFNCERCPGLVFGRIYELRRHNATTHGEEAGDTSARRFVCNDCGTAFNRMDALKRHIRRSQESIPCRVRLGLSGPGELQYEEPMAGQATGPVSPPGHHEAHAAQFLAPMPAAYPDGPYSAVADGHTTLGALLNGATRRLPDPSPAAPAFGAQPFEYGRQSPVYEFVAPSPAGSMRTPHYGHGEYGLPGRNGNAPYGPGTPVPASPLDLLAMVSPEPYSIGANGAAAGSAADRTYSPKAEEAVEDPNLAPANEPPANPVDFVPYPLLAAALLPSLPIPAPLKPLSTLYPNIPASLLPPWPVASYLISQFFEFDYVRMAGLHPPTFYDEVATGRVDPSLLLGTLLSGIRMADPEIGLAKARASGPAWERVFASDGGWARELRDECLHRLFSEWEALQRLPNLELDPASPDPVLLARLTNLMFFCHQCRYNAVVLGLASHHARIMEVFNGLFRLMRFGELAVDSVPPDPRNLPEYIRSEMRSRQCVIYILSDPVKADNSGILPVLYPPPPFERDGQGRWTTGWANMRMCSLPEVFLDALPASSTAPELWAGMLEAERTINLPGPPYRVTTSLLPVLSEPSPYTLGELYFRWSLPRDSPLRRSLSRYVGRGCLRGGYIWLQMAMADMWNRFVRCRRYFLARGWRLHAPPEGVTEEERAARRMRAELAEGTAEFFADLHREIAALVEQADGRGLRDLCEREWGRKWRPCL
ncbi:hypothetical protein DFJ74DRAFT_463537 [Hyaloraphidium curvatum]|nr:hypothetical protein DFJ74DRAFT_463537 [Hyaloraphidium curvatum]